MKGSKSFSLLLLSFFLASFTVAETTVVRDGEVTISAEEMEVVVAGWTPQMREVAMLDEGDRLELINLAVANKKLAQEADNRFVAENKELYWDYQRAVEAYKRNYLLTHYRDNLEYPDFTELAKEQYTLNKNKYAAIPERRMSSHILFSSPPGIPRDGVLAEAQEVLDQLRAGADFNEMVARHSGEPGAAERNGKFDRWLKYGEQGVSPPYTEGLFAIEAVGDYSELVQTQFGVHIIRLDGIQEKAYKPFEEVADVIIEELRGDYTKLALKDFVAGFQMSEDTVIDQAAMDKILEPYQSAE